MIYVFNRIENIMDSFCHNVFRKLSSEFLKLWFCGKNALEYFKLKSFSDDYFNVNHKLKFAFWKHFGKRRKCWLPAFLAHLSKTCSGWAIVIDQYPSIRVSVHLSIREQLLKKSSPLKPANRFQWNFIEMILGWCTFRKLQKFAFHEELWLPW